MSQWSKEGLPLAAAQAQHHGVISRSALRSSISNVRSTMDRNGWSPASIDTICSFMKEQEELHGFTVGKKESMQSWLQLVAEPLVGLLEWARAASTREFVKDSMQCATADRTHMSALLDESQLMFEVPTAFIYFNNKRKQIAAAERAGKKCPGTFYDEELYAVAGKYADFAAYESVQLKRIAQCMEREEMCRKYFALLQQGIMDAPTTTLAEENSSSAPPSTEIIIPAALARDRKKFEAIVRRLYIDWLQQVAWIRLRVNTGIPLMSRLLVNQDERKYEKHHALI